MPEMHPTCQINVARLCPDSYKVVCGTDTPSASLFDFQEPVPSKNFFGLNTEVTALKMHGTRSNYALLGTYGGTIINWDLSENKGKLSVLSVTCVLILTVPK